MKEYLNTTNLIPVKIKSLNKKKICYCDIPEPEDMENYFDKRAIKCKKYGEYITVEQLRGKKKK